MPHVTHTSRTYVMQVLAGREERVAELVRAMAGAHVEEVFLPRYEKRMHRPGGGSRVEQVPLAPGYLYLVTDNVDAVAQDLRGVPTLTRLLGSEAGFVPLTEDELAWMDALTRPGNRTIAMSRAVKEGDRVRIVAGPLMGHDADVVRVNVHKRLAWIEFPIMGRTKVVKVGLEVVRERRSDA